VSATHPGPAVNKLRSGFTHPSRDGFEGRPIRRAETVHGSGVDVELEPTAGWETLASDRVRKLSCVGLGVMLITDLPGECLDQGVFDGELADAVGSHKLDRRVGSVVILRDSHHRNPSAAAPLGDQFGDRECDPLITR
jgi:hypothetical protein